MIGPAGGIEGVGRARPAQPRGGAAPSMERATDARGRFEAVLRDKVARSLRWSRHAEERLRQEGVVLGERDRDAVADAVRALAGRGARAGLVVYGDLTLVVSVRNHTVITAARPTRLDDGVFTEIDAAAIVHQQPGVGPEGAGGAGEAPSPWIDGSGLNLRRSIAP